MSNYGISNTTSALVETYKMLNLHFSFLYRFYRQLLGIFIYIKFFASFRFLFYIFFKQFGLLCGLTNRK